MSIFAFSANQNNGFLAFADDGDIDLPPSGEIEFNDVAVNQADITTVSPGVVAIVYEDSSSDDGIVKTFGIDSDGNLSFIDELVFEDSCSQRDMDIIKVSNGIFAIAYKGGCSSDAFIVTVAITDNGAISSSILNKLNFEDDPGDDAVVITLVTEGVVAVIFEDDGPQTGIVKTFKISSNGGITLIDTETFESVDHQHDSDIVEASDGLFAIAYIGDGNRYWIRTVEIDNSGNIGSVNTKLQFNSGTANTNDTDNQMSIIQISDGVVALAYIDDNSGPNKGILKTFKIDSGDGSVSIVNILEFDDVDIDKDFEIIKIANPIVVIAYEDDDSDDGIIVTIAIENDGTITGILDEETFEEGSIEDPTLTCTPSGFIAIAYDGTDNGTLVTVSVEGTICLLPNFRGGGGGDSEQEYRTKPTFGLDHQTDFVLVEGGFTANGKVFDITDNWHTDFEKQAILVGQTNTFSAKAYAVHVLKEVEFMFGLPEIGRADLAEASIEVTLDFDQNVTNVRVVQKDNLIDPASVTATATMASCKSGDPDKNCTSVTVSGIFNEAPLGDVFALKGTDFVRKTHTTSLNEGFTIFGNSINPATTLFIASNVKGSSGLMQVTQIDKKYDIWVDESGIEYERNSVGSFFKTTVEHLIRDDPMVKVMTRMNSNFETMKQNELDKATAIFDSSLIQKELPDSYRIESGERSDKLQDPEVQLKLFIERMRADDKMNQLLQMWYAKPNPNQLN